MPSPPPARSDRRQHQRLRAVALVEGATLIALLFVAVPLKHVADWPLGVRVLGPLHGLAFVAYVWTVLDTVSGGGWSRGDTVRLLLAALVPFGGFATVARLRRRDAEAAS